MKVAIVHYHLQPGGVTRVIENTLQAWEENGETIDMVALTGRPYPGDRLPKTAVVEGLDYATPSEAVDPQILATRLKETAMATLGESPDLWHIHNHSLGKNPALTEAVAILAESGENMLLHPHDFAEDGRPGNYRSLQEVYSRAYPTGRRIHYAALNQRDQGFLAHLLKNSGSPVHLLANAVPPSPPLQSSKEGHISNLPENLILYPVRAVRRKNLGELALLSAAHPDLHFANSLGPTNPQFTPLFEEWKTFAKELNLSLTYALGESTQASFPEMVSHAQSILTVSVAEGFGLGFLEPWTFGKGLCGRNLPEITSDFSELGVCLGNLYDRLPIPLECAPSPEILKENIQSALLQFYQSYEQEIPEDAMSQAYDSMVDEDTIDFGRLNEDHQRAIIQKLNKSKELRNGVRIHSKISGLDQSTVQANAKAVSEQFSLTTYAKRTQSIYEMIVAVNDTEKCEFADGQRLLAQYLSPKRLNFLRTS